MRCNTSSGAGGFKQRTEEKWLEPGSIECVSPENQELSGGFRLVQHDLSKGTNRAHLLCVDFGLIQNTDKAFQLTACISGQIVVISSALLVRPVSHHHMTWMLWRTSIWFCQQIYKTYQYLSERENPTVQKHSLVPSCCICPAQICFSSSCPFLLGSFVDIGKLGYM